MLAQDSVAAKYDATVKSIPPYPSLTSSLEYTVQVVSTTLAMSSASPEQLWCVEKLHNVRSLVRTIIEVLAKHVEVDARITIGGLATGNQVWSLPLELIVIAA